MAYNLYPYFCGCYYYEPHVVTWQQRPRKYLPLLDSEAHSTILSTTSKTVLKQTFTNPSSAIAIKECIYIFPLYDGVGVVGFTCKIGSRILTGLVKEKTKAKEIFDQAVAKGETAGLLEQAPEASDVFSIKLGNIPAGQSVIVEITYIGELMHHETEGIRFTIPTSIATRYGSVPNHALATGNLAQPDGGIKITVDVNMPEGSFIKGVQSPSHPIAVSMGTISTSVDADPSMSKASATLSLGSAALEKDFVLIVQSKDIGIPKALLETHPTIPHHRALMATLVPKFALPPSRPEIVFVADRSGSMRGNIPMLISAMKVFLKSMPVGVKFNICSFGNHCTFLWDRSQSYSSDTLAKATAHVEGFSANMGGTETFNAVKQTIEKRFNDIPLEIILLTDGDIWRQEELFIYIHNRVTESNGQIRVFPLGIGSGVSSALIGGLARAGNGFSQSIQNGERLDNSVVRMLRGALTPHITNYSLEVKYEKDDDDFELIDKVTEGLKVLLSDVEKMKPQESKPIISLFDSAVDPEKEDVKMQDADYLPQVPHPKLLQAPHKIPSLFAFSRTTVYLLMSPETIQRNPVAIILRATSAHGPLALEIPIETLATPAETIHQLAAKKAVQDLEEGRGWIFDAKDQAGVLVKDRYPSRFDDLVQKEAVRLGEKFQVAGKWCSFVAVAANDAEIAVKQDKQLRSGKWQADSENDHSVDFAEDLDEPLHDFDFDSFLRTPSSPAFTSASADFSPVSPSYSPAPPSSQQPASPEKLQDYQMQLMLLEQQNKKRAFMTRSAAPMTQTSALPSGFGAPPVPNACYAPPAVPPQQQASSLFGQPQQVPHSKGMQSPFSFGNAGPQATGYHQQQQQQQQQPYPLGTQQSMHRKQSSPFNTTIPTPPGGGLFGGNALQSTASSSGLFGSAAPVPPPPGGRLFGGNAPQTTSSSNSFMNSAAPAPPPPSRMLLGMSASKATSPGSGPFGGAARGGRGGGLDGASKSRTSTDPLIDCLRSTAPPPAVPQSQAFSRGRFFSAGGSEAVSQKVAPTPENWTTKSVSEKVLALISLQDFEGSWSDHSAAEVSRIMGREISKAPKDIGQKAWVTLLLVSYLETSCAVEEGTWSLVVEKARDWLAGSWSASVSLESAEREAKTFWKA